MPEGLEKLMGIFLLFATINRLIIYFDVSGDQSWTLWNDDLTMTILTLFWAGYFYSRPKNFLSKFQTLKISAQSFRPLKIFSQNFRPLKSSSQNFKSLRISSQNFRPLKISFLNFRPLQISSQNFRPLLR